MIPYYDRDIKWEHLGSNKITRKWVVTEIHYDFDYDTYCIYKLEKTEYAQFGTPFGAYTHARNILNKYKKKWTDATIVIKEESV